jgi:8-oxo-dGTP pyrophosphatase MutT (NUDIX family)
MAVMHKTHGIIEHQGSSPRKTDYLFRISLKCLIQDNEGKVLVVKETGRDWWDLPGGGMDHGETLQSAITREMKEEVNLHGDFTFKIHAVEEPKLLDPHGFWQLRLIFVIEPSLLDFSPGDDGDEIAFMNPRSFKESTIRAERLIFEYSQLPKA